MATVSQPRFAEFERKFPQWVGYFPEQQRTTMLEEDLFAGKSVACVLIAIVLFGFASMITTVLFCL